MIELGCEYSELHVKSDNKPAIAMYTKKGGYEIKMKLPNHYYFHERHHDALLLVKTLRKGKGKMKMEKNEKKEKTQKEIDLENMKNFFFFL